MWGGKKRQVPVLLKGRLVSVRRGRHFIRDERIQTRLFLLMGGLMALIFLLFVLTVAFYPDTFQHPMVSSDTHQPSPEKPSLWDVAKLGIIALVGIGGMGCFIAGLIWVMVANARYWREVDERERASQSAGQGGIEEEHRS